MNLEPRSRPTRDDPSPRARLVLFRDPEASVPLLEWLEGLPSRVRAKCFVRLERLEERGHELRREASYLREGVYELRVRHVGATYRMLYFFHGLRSVVVTHGFSAVKRGVEPAEIERALERKRRFEADPPRHAFVPEERP